MSTHNYIANQDADEAGLHAGEDSRDEHPFYEDWKHRGCFLSSAEFRIDALPPALPLPLALPPALAAADADAEAGAEAQSKKKHHKIGRQERPRAPVLRNSIQSLTASMLRALAARAGVVTMDPFCFDHLRGVMTSKLHELIIQIVTHVEHRRSRNVLLLDVAAVRPTIAGTGKVGVLLKRSIRLPQPLLENPPLDNLDNVDKDKDKDSMEAAEEEGKSFDCTASAWECLAVVARAKAIAEAAKEAEKAAAKAAELAAKEAEKVEKAKAEAKAEAKAKAEAEVEEAEKAEEVEEADEGDEDGGKKDVEPLQPSQDATPAADDLDTNYARSLALIKDMQSSVTPVIPFRVFATMVFEVGQDYMTDLRWSPTAIRVLNEVAEGHLVTVLGKGLHCAAHRGATVLEPKDMQLAHGL